MKKLPELTRRERDVLVALCPDGDADRVVPATDGKATASRFTRRSHHVISGVGHNLPQEAPEAFAPKLRH